MERPRPGQEGAPAPLRPEAAEASWTWRLRPHLILQSVSCITVWSQLPFTILLQMWEEGNLHLEGAVSPHTRREEAAELKEQKDSHDPSA